MDTDEHCSPEMKAQILYLKGEELERKNRYYDAIVYYRKALRLVPDIDMRMYRGNSRLKDNNLEDNKENTPVPKEKQEDCDMEDEYDGNEPLIDRLNRIMDKSDNYLNTNKSQKHLHLSDLPKEIIMYILKWIVSDELDLRSLDQCALICRGFYLYARDPHLWKAACRRVWKNEEINLSKYNSWREMFINRPRISTNGCYIGETKYYRQGDQSFQDQNYKPYHLVVYYRYLRFFADGKVLMINTPDTPNVVVSQLKQKNSKIPALLCGTYEMVDDQIYVTFKLKRTRKNNNPRNSNEDQYIVYNMKFQIKKYKKYKTKLIWKQYTLSCSDEAGLEENFEIQEHLFPPLWFSRVKSYTAESERSLP